MCIEYVSIEKWSEVLGKSNKHRLMNIPLGLTAKADPRISYS